MDRNGHSFQYLLIKGDPPYDPDARSTAIPEQIDYLNRICGGCHRHEEKHAEWVVLEPGDGFCKPVGGISTL